jgi:hypothetical protein
LLHHVAFRGNDVQQLPMVLLMTLLTGVQGAGRQKREIIMSGFFYFVF